MESPILAQLDLTLMSPDYLDIEWEGICRLHIYLWRIFFSIPFLYSPSFDTLPFFSLLSILFFFIYYSIYSLKLG